MQSGFIRKEIYKIEDVLSKTVPSNTPKENCKVDFDGDLMKMNSQRYELFKFKGCKCVKCGIKGEYFAKERNFKCKSYHFNLYGTNNKGEEVLITKDHIIPKSKGGENSLKNYQTMCETCNKEKKDDMPII